MDLIKIEDGDLSFTSNGIEGALGFRLSRRAVLALMNGQRVELVLDLKPALSLEKLRARISRDLERMGVTATNVGRNRFRTLLRGLMPATLLDPFQHHHPDLSLSNLPDKLKEWRFEIKSYTGYERAVVTAGGIPQKEIIAKTMASKNNRISTSREKYSILTEIREVTICRWPFLPEPLPVNPPLSRY